jgi:hypothetical protein
VTAWAASVRRHKPAARTPAVVVSERKPRDSPQFHWVNTILGNLKTALRGAFHSLSRTKHADSRLCAFAYRFNRRFDLRNLLLRLIVDIARCPACRIRTIRGGAEERYQSGSHLPRRGFNKELMFTEIYTAKELCDACAKSS